MSINARSDDQELFPYEFRQGNPCPVAARFEMDKKNLFLVDGHTCALCNINAQELINNNTVIHQPTPDYMGKRRNLR